MALIRCRTCGGTVSSDANPPCPHCKDPYVTEERKRQAEIFELEYEKRKKEENRQEAIRNKRKWSGLCPCCGGPMKLWTGKYSGSMVCANDCGYEFHEDSWLQNKLEREERQKEEKAKTEQKRREEERRLWLEREERERPEREERERIKKKKQRFWTIFSIALGGIVGGFVFAFLAKDYKESTKAGDFIWGCGIIIGLIACVSFFIWSICYKRDDFYSACGSGCVDGCLCGFIGGIIIAAIICVLVPAISFMPTIAIGVVVGAVAGYFVSKKKNKT